MEEKGDWERHTVEGREEGREVRREKRTGFWAWDSGEGGTGRDI
jgi:hypothetical protein